MSNVEDFQKSLTDLIKADLEAVERANRIKLKAKAQQEARRRAALDEQEDMLRKLRARDSGYNNRLIMRQVKFGSGAYRPSCAREFIHDVRKIQAYSERVPFIVPAADWKIVQHDVLRPKAVAAAFRIAHSTLKSWVAKGLFPQPLGYQLVRTGKRYAYTVDEIAAYSRHFSDCFPSEMYRPFLERPQLAGELHTIQRQVLAVMIDHNAKLKWKMLHD